jgi:hypothetical protein
MGVPFAFDLPPWPIIGWMLHDVVHLVGSDTEIQYQARRLDDPDYETRSHAHREIDRFDRFAMQILTGETNDVYLTAQKK